MYLQDEDLDGDGVLSAGEVRTTAAPATPATPATPAAPGATPATPATPAAPSGVPPWIQQFRAAQDARRNDFRSGMDAFYGGLGKIFEGDVKGGFGQWGDFRDQRREDFRNRLNERFDKWGDRFQMPAGFASRLPWNQGKSGASGLGGSTPPAQGQGQGVAPGEPNPSAPGAKPAGKPGQGAGGGSWWALGNRKPGQGAGSGWMGYGQGAQTKPAKQPKPAASKPKDDEDEAP